MSRSTIYKKIKKKTNQIEKLMGERIELRKQYLLLSDKKMRYKEDTITRGRGKNKKTVLEGRVYWMETFTDDDTGEKIKIERSECVTIDGVWQSVLFAPFP